MRIKEGVIPTVIGTVVTAGAAVMRANDMRRNKMEKRDIVPMVETAVLGFGLAHVVLGAIDIIEHR